MELLARRMRSGLKNTELPATHMLSAVGWWLLDSGSCPVCVSFLSPSPSGALENEPKSESSIGEKQYSAGRAESGMEMVFSFTAAEAASYS